MYKLSFQKFLYVIRQICTKDFLQQLQMAVRFSVFWRQSEIFFGTHKRYMQMSPHFAPWLICRHTSTTDLNIVHLQVLGE